MQKLFFLLIFALIFLLSAIFAAFNMTAVSVDYYFGQLSMPLSVLLILAVVVGVILGAIVLSISFMKLRYENHRLKQKLALSEDEINSLRILPIKDTH
ncbi:hypothetical protein LCGC14_1223140 [marine sediment metagenome]|uniref:Lipopolysaccharide assembly protein A domain-containing protein n=1 Tax=marine sediment metagenome TaxID=412755 RepID=A0A0F9NT09_9ZZZZ